MALPVITDTIRAAVEGRLPNGQNWANVMHFRKTGALSYTGAIAILDPLLYALWNSVLGTGQALKAFAPTTWTMLDIKYTPLDGSTPTSTFTHVLLGTNAGQALPSQVALVVSLRTALRGRSYRGRFYLAGWTEADNDAVGNPVASTVALIANQAAAWLATFTGSGVTPVVASYLHSTAENVVGTSVDGVWDTQRKRLR